MEAPSTQKQAEIAANHDFVADFPELPSPLIERQHLLRSMVEILEGEAQILFLEGDAGDGATSALAQFCHAYPEQTFSLFIKPASKLTYSLDYLRIVLAEQYHWSLYGESLSKDRIAESEYRDLSLKIIRKSKYKRLYFVVDGLHQIPPEDQAVISQVFSDLLPTGFPGCRLIISGLQAELGTHAHRSVKSRYYQLLKFSIEECKTFLSDLSIDAAEAERIYELCKGGSPGRLAVVRRLLLSGTSLADILEKDPGKYLEFVKLEFECLRAMKEQECLLVANIAYSKVAQTVTELGEICELTSLEIGSIVKRCGFLRTSTQDKLEFISETHRLYAARQLDDIKRLALERQLEFFEKNPKSEAALRYLPTYLETLNRKEAIFDVLSKEHYCDLLESTQSFASLMSQAEMAEKNAMAMQRTQEVFKFSLQRSIFLSASSVGGASAQIKSLVAMGKSNNALAVANAEATKENRLALLSTFARRVMERSGKIDPELGEHIKSLISGIDFSVLGDIAIGIAADVLIFDPDSAIGIIEAAVKGATAATKDMAYAQLSISASMAKIKNKAKIEDKARPRISDESLQQVAHSFELLAGQLDSSTLVPILSKMPAAHQIHFLRSFVSMKRNDARILDLVDLGLDIIIKEAEYTPRARDLAELCAPFLSSIEDHGRLKKLVTRVQSQVGLVSKAAQSRDVTMLQMRLAAAEYQYDKSAARDRVRETCYSVMEIKAPEVQMECLAVMLGVLVKVDKDDYLEASDGFRSVIKSELNRVLDLVLKDTADHIATLMPVLKVLAAEDGAGALQLAGRLNAEYRRNLGNQSIARVLVAQPYTLDRLGQLKTALQSITCEDMRARATEGLLGGLDTNSEKSPWIAYLDQFRGNLMRGYQLSNWDCWMLKESKAAEVVYGVDLFIERTKEALQRTASVHEEAELNFNASEALAEVDLAAAENFYSEGMRLSQTTPFASRSKAQLFELCLSLVGRSMASLARTNALDEDKLSRHDALVDRLPGLIGKVRALSEFAERMWCAGRDDLAKKIVNEKIRGYIEQARSIHPSVGRLAARIAFPPTCALHQRLALGMINDLADADADDALNDAAMLRLRHLAGKEPSANGKFDHSRVEVADVYDVIELIAHMRTDRTIAATMRTLVDAINDKVNRTKFTGTQKADWSGKLKEIVGERLPDKKNIQHSGYFTVCTAMTLTLVETQWSQWQSLVDEAEKVPNRADRGYIFVMLSVLIPVRFLHHRKILLQRGLDEIHEIPSPLDRLSHMQGYAQDAYANDAVASSKECLKMAMKLSLDMENHSRVSEHRRELIDLADQIDPGLADELIEMVDDDPARLEMKSEAKHVAALAKAKRSMANAKQLKDAEKYDQELLPAAAWQNLGALEAGRLEIKSPDLMINFVSQSCGSTIEDAYPVLCWHITNMERKYIHAQDVKSQLTPLCEALLLSTELAESILRRIASRAALVREDENDEGLLVRRRSRDEAISFISQWLQSNAKEEIIYCDPYFSTKDIQLLRLCIAHAPDCRVQIIASKPQLLKQGELSEEPFLKAWREQSDQSPPETEIIAPAYIDTPDKNVVHDRWLLTRGAGLRFGTSFNSLGDGKLSEISEVDPGRVRDLADQLGQYLTRQRVVDAAKIQYSTFTL